MTVARTKYCAYQLNMLNSLKERFYRRFSPAMRPLMALERTNVGCSMLCGQYSDPSLYRGSLFAASLYRYTQKIYMVISWDAAVYNICQISIIL